MRPSFRLRLALVAAAISGLTLGGFGLAAWWIIRDVKIERLDAQMRASAEREAARRAPAPDWPVIDANLARNLGSMRPGDYLLLVQEGQREVIYRSPGWPGELDAARFPWPAARRPPGADPSDPLPPRRRPPPGGFDGPGREPPEGDLPADAGARPFPPRVPPATAVANVAAAGEAWRVVMAVAGPAHIAVAGNLRVVDAEMAAIRNAFLLALAPALLLMAFGAWFISTRALRPVDQLSDTIRQVTAAGLGQRIEIRTADREFVQLINVFNAMLERLEASFGQASRFSADAAHELKTPLAILQGQIERSLAEAEAGSPLQVRLTVILDEVRRLSMISQKLLMLAQADAGRLPLQLETLDVSAMLEELVDDARMLAPQLRITGDIPPGLIASADAGLVQQILHNLISNAIKYNVDGGWVRIAASMTAREVLVSVSNPSHSIAAGEGSLIFQRFYRADRARARDIDGFGLGLNLSREIARAHGGDLTFEVAADQRVLLLLSLPRGETPQRHRSGS